LELNLARISANVNETERQAMEFVRRLEQPGYEPYRSQWKMLNLFVGGINLCHVCEVNATNEKTHESTPENVGLALDRLLEYLFKHLPRDDHGRLNMFVNVYTLFPHVSTLYHWGHEHFWCRKVLEIGKICHCLFDGDSERQWMDDATATYNQAILTVIRKWQQRTRNELKSLNWRVSADRTLELIDLAELNFDFISRTDCFHPNECYHRLAAYKSWQALTLNDHRMDDPRWYLRGPVQWSDCSTYESARLIELS
jgi:hypothetical protein